MAASIQLVPALPDTSRVPRPRLVAFQPEPAAAVAVKIPPVDTSGLVERCQRGESEAFRELFHAHRQDVARLAQLSRYFNIPLLATNGVHYHDPHRRALQDVLTCIRHGCTIHEAGYKLFPNAERHLKSPEQMHRLFVELPQARRFRVAGPHVLELPGATAFIPRGWVGVRERSSTLVVAKP